MIFRILDLSIHVLVELVEELQLLPPDHCNVMRTHLNGVGYSSKM